MTTKNTTTVVFVPFKNRSTIAPLKSENLKIANSAKRDSYTKGPTFCGQQILCHSRGPGVPVIPHLSCWGVEGVCGWGGGEGGEGERERRERSTFVLTCVMTPSWTNSFHKSFIVWCMEAGVFFVVPRCCPSPSTANWTRTILPPEK